MSVPHTVETFSLPICFLSWNIIEHLEKNLIAVQIQSKTDTNCKGLEAQNLSNYRYIVRSYMYDVKSYSVLYYMQFNIYNYNRSILNSLVSQLSSG